MQQRLEFYAFQFIKRLILALPLKSAQRFGAAIGSAAYHLAGSRRRVALENLGHAFPELTEESRRRIAKGAFRNYGIALVELLWFPNLTDTLLRTLVTIRNPEVIAQGNAKGKGMIMLSGHFGNWELIALGAAYISGLPYSIIVQTQANKRIDEVINRHRCLFGNTVIPMGMSVRGIIKALNEGRVVAIAPDQSGPMEGAFVEFFGRSVATHQGPAAFALRSGAPLQMGIMVRKSDGTYDVTIEEIPSSDLAGPTEENIVELTRRHTAVLERWIRLHPDHWLWMHRRWKHTWESVHGRREPAGGAHA